LQWSVQQRLWVATSEPHGSRGLIGGHVVTEGAVYAALLCRATFAALAAAVAECEALFGREPAAALTLWALAEAQRCAELIVRHAVDAADDDDSTVPPLLRARAEPFRPSSTKGMSWLGS